MVHLMNKRHIFQSDKRAGLRFLVVLVCCSLAASAQDTIHREDTSSVFSVRATHLLGFETAKNNRNGTLTIQDNLLQFQHNDEPSAQVKIGLIRDVVLGEESKQVGGLPMTLGKAAAPFGSGRVVSLVAHKKYDILTLEYVDDDGGIHGAIFQLQQGQAEIIRHELQAHGVIISSHQAQNGEVTHENK
jgi:hypothetical protein